LKAHKETQKLEHEALGALPMKDWVFTSLTGDAFNPENLNRVFNTICKAAEVRKIRLHDLRHTHVSLARRQGVALEVVSARLGHTRSSFTADVYRHTFEDEIEEAAIPLSSLLAAPRRLAN
jgi:integrase